MKRILSALLILMPLLLNAQGRFDAHVFAGLNMCQIDGDASDGYSHPGLRAGVGTSFALGDDLGSPWRMVVEMAFSNKGSHVKSIDRSFSINYIEIPIMLSYNAMNNRLRVAAGVAPAIRVGYSVTQSGSAEIGWEENLKSIDWLPLTFSLRYLFTDHLGIEARFQYSALSVTQNTGSGTYFLIRSNKGCFHNLLGLGLTYKF